jgi:hypothetical protein
MTLKKPSEIDLELDRLQADLDRCGAEQKALDAQKQERLRPQERGEA